MKYVKTFKLFEIYKIENHKKAIRENNISYFDENRDYEKGDNILLILATIYGRIEIVKKLVNLVDVNQTNHLNRTAAYYTNNLDILFILLENGLNFDHEDDHNELFLHYFDDDKKEIIYKSNEYKKYLRNKKAKEFNL